MTFTRGQAGSRGQPPLCAPEELGAVRTNELRCSCQALGVEEPQVLDYADGSLTQVRQEEGAARITACIQSIRPQVLLTWPPDGLSGHPDHQAVSRWTLEAFRQSVLAGVHEPGSLYCLAFPSSLAEKLGVAHLHAKPDSEITIAVNVESVWDKKMAAIHCHRTQMGETPILTASEENQRLFLGMEHFTKLACRNERDFFFELLRPYAPV